MVEHGVRLVLLQAGQERITPFCRLSRTQISIAMSKSIRAFSLTQRPDAKV